LNCLIWRLHSEESIMGRSYCPKCRKQIVWYDNIPVFSFLFLGGKCRYCKKKISVQYPVVEFITGILFTLAFIYAPLHPSQEGNLLRSFFIISVMIIIFIYDLRWYLILDKVTIPAGIIVFFINILLDFNWINLLISGIIGSSFFLFQFIISRGKWIGGGDIRLGALMGLALGWPMVILAIFLAYLIGSVVGIGLILGGKKKWGSMVPLGVFLSTASIITLFWGSEILSWYLGIIQIY